MKVSLWYLTGSVEIVWNLPFFPRIGEHISTCEILSEKESEKLSKDRDYFQISNISWFPSDSTKEPHVEIILE